jgi:cholesterol transport system auxiliary component
MAIRRWIPVAAAILCLAGCFRGAKAPAPEERYILEYPSPGLPGAVPLSGAIRIGRFGADESLKTTRMVFRPEPFRKETDFYNLWAVTPDSLVTDFLLRDFRRAGPFRTVFAEGDPQPARFLLHGYLEGFEETDGPGGRVAMLGVTATLFDLSRKGLPERILFQKGYRFEEPLQEKSARGLARAMSRAVERLSAELVRDVHTAAARREGEGAASRHLSEASP